MEKTLSVLLVEDEAAECNEIIKVIDALDDVTLVGVTNHSSEAIRLIQDCRPDAVILDLELHKGSGNGFLVLEGLRQLSLDFVPYILITTNNTSAITYEFARQLGADFIMAKHQDDYSPKNAVEFLRMMQPAIHSRNAAHASARAAEEPPEIRKKRIRARIMTELNNIGVSPKAVGYAYLVDAIEMIVSKPVQNLCAVIGQKYGKTDSSVERAMQNAINRTWRVSDIDDLCKYYTARISSDKGVPTLTEFIYYYANKIKAEY
jgi:two-component system response regulator (stage 0 sporulation protein A)